MHCCFVNYGSCLSSLYSIPMSYDPIIYGIVGNGWMEGLMPYRDLFDQKGPLIILAGLFAGVGGHIRFHGVQL